MTVYVLIDDLHYKLTHVDFKLLLFMWRKLFSCCDAQTPVLIGPRTTWCVWGGEDLCFCCWWGGRGEGGGREVLIFFSVYFQKLGGMLQSVWKWHHWLCCFFLLFTWRIPPLILILLFLRCLLLLISCLLIHLLNRALFFISSFCSFCFWWNSFLPSWASLQNIKSLFLSLLLSVLGNDAAVPCAVVKTVDSFSFLHHPVHQRSLEILQRCKDEKYSKLPQIPKDSYQLSAKK